MAKKEKTKKSAKDKLSAGAADIKKAQKELEKAKPEPIVLAPLTQSTQEIVRDRVTMFEGNIGLELSKDTSIEETLVIQDWAMQMSDHVGFMIGDILNFGSTKFGQKYAQALNQTGRALSTLKGYSEASRRIPPSKRVAALSFTHHREILRLPDEKMATVLKEVGAQAEKAAKAGEAGPSTREVRFKVQKLTPRKKKTPKKVTSGKGKKKKAKLEAPPYQPDADEQAKLDDAEAALIEASETIKSAKLYQIVAKLDNKEKKRWLEMVLPIVTFYNAVDRVTGY